MRSRYRKNLRRGCTDALRYPWIWIILCSILLLILI